MLRERILPQSELIRAIILEGSPCCGVPHLRLDAEAAVRVPAPAVRASLDSAGGVNAAVLHAGGAVPAGGEDALLSEPTGHAGVPAGACALVHVQRRRALAADPAWMVQGGKFGAAIR